MAVSTRAGEEIKKEIIDPLSLGNRVNAADVDDLEGVVEVVNELGIGSGRRARRFDAPSPWR